MESFRELTDTELEAVSGGAAAAAAGTGTVAVAAATNSPTVSALLFNVGTDHVNNDGPGAIVLSSPLQAGGGLLPPALSCFEGIDGPGRAVGSGAGPQRERTP